MRGALRMTYSGMHRRDTSAFISGGTPHDTRAWRDLRCVRGTEASLRSREFRPYRVCRFLRLDVFAGGERVAVVTGCMGRREACTMYVCGCSGRVDRPAVLHLHAGARSYLSPSPASSLGASPGVQAVPGAVYVGGRHCLRRAYCSQEVRGGTTSARRAKEGGQEGYT